MCLRQTEEHQQRDQRFIGTWYQTSTAPAGSNGIIDDQALYFLKDTYTLGADGNYIAESEIKFIHQNKAEAEEKYILMGNGN